MSFNPQRLSIARKRRMLNKKSLAEKLDLEPLTITRWEKFQSAPTSENLRALAKILDYPESFFFGPDIEEPLPEVTSFRSQSAITTTLRNAALAAGAIGFQVLDWVEAKFDLPASDLPDLQTVCASSNPETAADALRQLWNLGQLPISNMIHLLESKGVRVFSLSEQTATVDAYSLRRGNGSPCVFLNTFKTAERSRFDAAHELGHLVLHGDGKVTGREAEDQANEFASAFLMPQADVLAQLRPIHSLDYLVRAKARWKVSAAALLRRAHQLHLASDWRYRDLNVLLRQRYGKNEPSPIDREASIVWEKVLKALWAEGVTQSDIADKIGVSLTEVHSLLFQLVRSPVKEGDLSKTLRLL